MWTHAAADCTLLEKMPFFILLEVFPPLSSGRTKKILCRVETRAVLSWEVSLHFICFCNMFHICGISSWSKYLKILNLHFYYTTHYFPYLQKTRFLFKELHWIALSNSKFNSVQVELPSWEFSDK